MQKKIKLLCTLGPSSFDKGTITRLDALGIDIFRINLSHTEINHLEDLILQIKQCTNKPICLDTEGAQIRTGYINNNKVYLQEGSILEITSKKIVGNANKISLNPSFLPTQLKTTDLISVDFDSVILWVMKCKENSVIAKVVSGGYVGSNKAVTIDRHIKLPVISEKDKEAIRIGLKHGIQNFALSFANSKNAVDYFRKLVGNKAYIISKIESKKGLKNLNEILKVSNAILIDRGDLAREEPIEKIPFIQKLVIKEANARKVPVYVATNLLESMLKSKKPNRSEASDVINTLMDGADGLVLAAETAIGVYPVNCTVMISKMVSQFLNYQKGCSFEELQKRDSFLIVEPHGGVLVNRVCNSFDMKELKEYKTLEVDKSVLLNAEQIAIGTFSPLEGFMNKKDVDSVLRNYRLSNGIIWSLPIVLQTTKEEAVKLNIDDNVVLVLRNTGEAYAILHVEDIYKYNLDKMSEETFGTNDSNHPGVQLFKKHSDYFLGGKITLLKRLPSQYKHYEVTPRQARAIFENRGWSRVVGFHTRNVIHRVHEYIQMSALRNYHCDGLFVHPVVGPKKRGDYNPGIILKTYELMMDKYYPKGKIFLAAFQTYSRYAGPREAVFSALCRKNFGCSHFIIGRDHTGVGNYYGPNDAHKLFDYLGDIGIVPIFFNNMHYCKKCQQYVEQCRHGAQDLLSISGTEARAMLKSKVCPPDWFMRKDISNLIFKKTKNKNKLFI